MTREEMVATYLDKLGLSGQPVSIEFIQAMQSHHIAQFSFNSLAVVLGQDISLELADIFKKIVLDGRGGYCFEHNKLFYEVLSHLGVDVQIKMARVVYNKDIDVPRTHRISLMKLNGESYIVDAGFGHFGPRYPVRLELGEEQIQGGDVYRITASTHDRYCFQMLKDGAFFTLYTFDLNHYTDMDCLTGHFYSHKHPNAGFVNNLVISKKYSHEVISLRNHEVHRIVDHKSTVSVVDSEEMLHDVLSKTFELKIDRAVVSYLYNKFIERNDVKSVR